MLGKKKAPNKGTLNSELVQRIDNMDDMSDYNPYQAIKRTTIDTEELFSDENYTTEDEDSDEIHVSAGKVIAGIVIGILAVLIVGAIMLFVIK